MAFASSVSAGDGRISSFMPMVKCSGCGNHIEISRMGEHSCNPGDSAGVTSPSSGSDYSPTSNSPTLNRSSTARASSTGSFVNFSGRRPSNAVMFKPAQPSPLQLDSSQPCSRARAPTLGASSVASSIYSVSTLPRINADIANKPFQGSFSQPQSPASPARSATDPWYPAGLGPMPSPKRSITTPVTRLNGSRPPSSEMAPNLGCAFPPFPTGGARTAPASNDRAPLSSSRSVKGTHREIDGRGPTSSGLPANAQPKQDLHADIPKRRPSPLVNMHAGESGPHTNMLPSNEGMKSSKSPLPQRPPRPHDTLSPTFLKNMSAKPLTIQTPAFPDFCGSDNDADPPYNQANDVARPSGVETYPRQGAGPGRTRGRSFTATNSQAPGNSSTLARPERGEGRNASRTNRALADVPPVPNPVHQLHRTENQHRPSDSGSSTASSYNSNTNSNSTAGPSPLGSSASSFDAQSPVACEHDRVRGPAASARTPHFVTPGLRAELPKERKSPPRQLSSLAPITDTTPPDLQQRWPSPSHSNEPRSRSPKLLSRARCSPYGHDNASQTSLRSQPSSLSRSFTASPEPQIAPYPPYQQNNNPLQKSPPPPQFLAYAPQRGSRSKPNAGAQPFIPPAPPKSQDLQAHQCGQSPRSPSHNSAVWPLRPPSIPEDPPRKPASGRRPTTAKPICRGCGLTIDGKSVKAADGRLTGRWHKACFVCRTCDQPFITADFYVIRNHPYCEQHYHERNGSLCHGCHRGIEGPYLETLSSPPAPPGAGGGAGAAPVDKKFHPRCFTCFDCRVALIEDYFEISGRIFCERHALANMRAQARAMAPTGGRGGGGSAGGMGPPTSYGRSGLQAERRTTRLMVMA